MDSMINDDQWEKMPMNFDESLWGWIGVGIGWTVRIWYMQLRKNIQ